MQKYQGPFIPFFKIYYKYILVMFRALLYNFIDTKNAIKEAIKKERAVIKGAPTDYKYIEC